MIAVYGESNSKTDAGVQFKEECAVNKVSEISLADYNTILLHAEKINNGQHDFTPVLRRELHDKLNIGDEYQLVGRGNFCEPDLVGQSILSL